MYNLEMVNKSFDDKRFSLQISDENYKLVVVDTASALVANSEMKRVFMLKQNEDQIKDYKKKVTIEVLIDTKPLKTFETTFFGPIKMEE